MTPSRKSYIELYKDYAMEQMRRYGIPASVTLAQGIIESADGKSTLANTANNHFGVKGEFNGQYVRADDDKPNEKFKKYDNVGQSYEDHSKVLMADRYQKYTKNLSPDDYKGWAAGIKAGGYATSKNYVNTIVGVIEGADLHKYDQQVMAEMKSQNLTIGTHNARSESKSNVSSVDAQDNQYSFPLERKEFLFVTSPFGMRTDPMDKSKQQMHKGIDIKANHDAIMATEMQGKVVAVNQNANTAGGKSITVEYQRADNSKVQVSYMHLDSIAVKAGDEVKAGQKLGVSGNTGTRTTGPHLHLAVKNISADGNSRDVDPAAYLAEIAQKGNIQQQALHDGKDLLAKYKDNTNPENQLDENLRLSPDEWMKKLLSSEDSSVGMSSADPIMEMAATMYAGLLTLAIQIDNKPDEEKTAQISESVANRMVDLKPLMPSMKECQIVVKEDGKMNLVCDNGSSKISKELSSAEQSRLSMILGDSSLSEESKKIRIAGLVNNIVLSKQASQNYKEAASQQQTQTQSIQR